MRHERYEYWFITLRIGEFTHKERVALTRLPEYIERPVLKPIAVHWKESQVPYDEPVTIPIIRFRLYDYSDQSHEALYLPMEV
jgi:hypothetical protein